MTDGFGFEIPGYDIVEQIGQGAFARVYLGTQRQYARQVAVKVLDFGLDDQRLKTQFARECAATGSLAGHPNILIVLDSGFTTAGAPYLTSAFCEQGSLADRVARNGPLPIAEVLRIGVKLAGALDTAHRAGLVHRDVKPENVLLSGFGEPMLADWGIATITSRLSTKVTMAAMTPSHASPEVLASKPASASSDIYALGSTLYSLLAGRPPFRMEGGQNILAVILKATEDPVPPIPRPDVPPRLFDAIGHAMAKAPADRPASAADFGHTLQQVQYQLGIPYTELVTKTGATVDTGPVPAAVADPASPPAQPIPTDTDTLAPARMFKATVVRPGGVVRPAPIAAQVAQVAQVAPVAPDDPLAPAAPVAAVAAVAAVERPEVLDASPTVMRDRHAPPIERPHVEPAAVRQRSALAMAGVSMLVIALLCALVFFGLGKLRSTGTGGESSSGSIAPIRGGRGVGSGGDTGTAPAGQVVTPPTNPSSTSSTTGPQATVGASGSAATAAAGDAKPPRAIDVQRTDAGLAVQWTDDNASRYPFIYEVLDKAGKRLGKTSSVPSTTKSVLIAEADTGPLDPGAVYCVAVGVISSTARPVWADARCTDGSTAKVS